MFGVYALEQGWMPLYAGFPLRLDSLGMWCRFDSTMYLKIVNQGYYGGYFGTAGWFPGYPMLAVPLVPYMGDVAALILVSNLALVIAIFLLYRLDTLDSDPASTRRGLLLLLLFPSAFMLSTAYSESVYLMFAAGSFLAVRKKRLTLSVLLAAGAASTRLTGLMLIPALGWELWCQEKRMSKKFLVLAIPLVGPLTFFFHLYLRAGNFFEYFKVQGVYGSALGLWTAVSSGNELMLEQRTGLIFLVIQIAALAFCWRRMRGSYRVFVLSSIVIAFYHTQGLCTQRFMLVLFPLFFESARAMGKRLYWIILVASVVGQFYFFSLWLYGYRATY